MKSRTQQARVSTRARLAAAAWTVIGAIATTGCESDSSIPRAPVAGSNVGRIVVTDPGRPDPLPQPAAPTSPTAGPADTTQANTPVAAPISVSVAAPNPALAGSGTLKIEAAGRAAVAPVSPPAAEAIPFPKSAAPAAPVVIAPVTPMPTAPTTPPDNRPVMPPPSNAPDAAALFDAQLARLMSGQPAPSAAELTVLPKDEQELISATVDAINNFRSGLRNSATATSESKAQPLIDLGRRAQSVSGFSVPALRMTSRILSYGVYDVMPAQISPNRLTPTALYAEVTGFSSRQIDGGLWETRLVMTLTMYGPDNSIVWQHEPEQFPDRCKNRRTDFFVVSKVSLPALPSGTYTLKATLSDTLASRVAEANLSIVSK